MDDALVERQEAAAFGRGGSNVACAGRPEADSAPVSFRGYIPSLDGLRAVAILFVICHHFWPSAGPLSPLAHIAHVGWIGVDLFFVISGFLICGILLDTRGAPAYFRNFYGRRALRIFPLYYLFLAVMAIGIPILQQSSELFDQSGSLWWYVLYGGNIREAITGHEPAYVLAPLWSLSIEEQFYISFPLIVWFLGARRLWNFLWLLVIAAPVFRLAAFFLWPGNERIQYLSTFSRMDSIAVGCLIATGFRLGRLRFSVTAARRAAVCAALLLAAVFALNGLDRTLPFCRIVGYSITAFAFAAIVIWAVMGRPWWLQLAPLTGLGGISYGVYLLQRPSQVALGKLLSKGRLELGPTSLLFADIAAAILVAAISWNVFEKHVLKLKSRFVTSRRGTAAEPLVSSAEVQ